MSMNSFDISDDLQIVRFSNGIKLLSPDRQNNRGIFHTVGSIKNLQFSVYFLNKQGKTQSMNDEGALVCGFGSADNSIGKTLLDVSDETCARQLLENCTDVINNNTIKIFEEKNLRKDDTCLQFLSIKSPWYDDNDNIIGLMGCSVVMGQHSLSDSLAKIAELGLFNASQIITPLKNKVPQIRVNDIYLTNREIECLRFTIKGYTAKKIAKVLSISHRTVEEYLANIRFKMGAVSKSELIEMTIDNFFPELLSPLDENS